MCTFFNDNVSQHVLKDSLHIPGGCTMRTSGALNSLIEKKNHQSSWYKLTTPNWLGFTLRKI